MFVRAKKQMKMYEKTEEFKNLTENNAGKNDEESLSFNDLDKEWELVNAAISNLNDKYRENLTMLE